MFKFAGQNGSLKPIIVNFAPRVTQPKLILKGRDDEAYPLKTDAEPLIDLLREPRRIVIVESTARNFRADH